MLTVLVLFELITLVVVPIYGTIASGYGALSETYAHNLKYRRAQMKGAGCPGQLHAAWRRAWHQRHSQRLGHCLD